MFSSKEQYERFFNSFSFSTGCWEWTGSKHSQEHPYGIFFLHNKKERAHRISYELFVGKIPDGLHIDHLCRNKSCINPAHLEVVTHVQNIMRGDCVGAINARKTHCIYGHPLSGKNLSLRPQPDGRVHRLCLACARRRQRKSVAKRKAKLAS